MQIVSALAPTPVTPASVITPVPIGFVVLSHSEPALLRRLLRALDRAYRNPPIAVHHDFSQCALPVDVGRWSADLQFVRPHVETQWAHISIVEGFLAALENLYAARAPDWFVLLSASDFPVREGSTGVRELACRARAAARRGQLSRRRQGDLAPNRQRALHQPGYGPSVLGPAALLRW